MRRSLFPGIAACAVALTAIMIPVVSTTGCGAGNSLIDPTASPTPTPTPVPVTERSVSVKIDWAARSRNVGAPSSALSARITVRGAKPGGGDVSFVAERPAGTVAVSETYQSPEPVLTGSRRIEVVFFGNPGAVGSVVATAGIDANINFNDGTFGQSVGVERKVASVEVTSGQKLSTGEQRYLTYTARDAGGNVVAVSPGSAFFTVTGGDAALTTNGEVAEGVAGGTTQVTATIDGVASAPTPVTVLASVRVAIVANPDDAQVIAFKQLLTSRRIAYTAYNDVPDPTTLQNADVLMVIGSLAVPSYLSSDDATKIKDYLDTGRGVMLFAGAPQEIARNEDNMEDISVISPWFGGATRLYSDADGVVVPITEPNRLFSLPPSTQAGQATYDNTDRERYWHTDKDNITNPTADIVLISEYYDNSYSSQHNNVMAFSFAPSSGGRVYYQFHPYGINSTYSAKIMDLTVAAMNWTAGR